jgi:4-hydroxy-tetrahydrodipicolinate synthase
MKNSLTIQPNELKGVYTAIITPMHETGEIHWEKLEMLINDQISAGITGIVACGTTGQSATLNFEEKIELIKFVSNKINNRAHFIAGAGSNNTTETIKLMKSIEETLDSPLTFLTVTGYYNNPTQDGIYHHFEKLAKNIHEKSNLILYNVPSRTNSNIYPETLKKLSENPKIIGIKEASGNLNQVEQIIKTTNLKVLSGEDDLFFDILNKGGTGIISASTNIAPKPFLNIYKYYEEQNIPESRRTQHNINALVKTIFYRKNPIPLAHIFHTGLRLPLIRAEPPHTIITQDNINPYIDEFFKNYKPEYIGINRDKYK